MPRPSARRARRRAPRGTARRSSVVAALRTADGETDRAGGFFFSSRRRHTRCLSDWSSDVCSSDLAVADAVQRCFARGSDLVARYGGEEFVVLATGVERRHARERAELLRRAISGLTIEGATRSNGRMITVSVGVATAVPDDRILPEDLLLAADRSLYQAKRLGRDRVVQAPSLRAYADAA